MDQHNIFVVDDDRTMRESLAHLLSRAGFSVETFFRASDVLTRLHATQPDVILTDMKMPGLSGLELLEQVQQNWPEIPVVLISAHGDVPLAVEAMGKGAYNFLEKPFEPTRLLTVLRHAAENHRLTRDNRNLRSQLTAISGLDRVLLGTTDAMVSLREDIVDFAGATMPVLLMGETGTGKEVVARALHNLGPRSQASFVAVNCAASTKDGFARLMFGDQDGSDIGYFARADGGTLFLDEFDALTVDHQGALMRILESGELSPEGGTQTRKIDVRVISASNRDLENAVTQGTLREDLLFRLNTIALSLPPLRNRRDDIALLYTHFVQQLSQTYEVQVPDMTSEDHAALLLHGWPGNVRELRHVAERRVLSARRGLGSVAEAIAPAGESDDIPDTLRQAVAAFERGLIGKALTAHGGKMDAVAEALGIGRRTLNEKMVKLNLDRADFV